jgi:hypothetical protein
LILMMYHDKISISSDMFHAIYRGNCVNLPYCLVRKLRKYPIFASRLIWR